MDWHKDNRALVTGGAQGLGLAVASELIAQGCQRLVIADINETSLLVARDQLAQSGAEVHALNVDMSDADAAINMVEEAETLLGGVTVLANCAASTERGSVLDTDQDLYDRIMATNAKGPFFALQRFALANIAAKREATALNILSIVVHGGLPVLAPYGASKAALLYMTKNAANTLARHRIRVNGINVGWMDTPGEDQRQKVSHNRSDGWLEEAEASTPFGKLVKPEEVARLGALLLGPQSGVVTGSIIDFDQQVVGAYPNTDDM